MGTLARRASGTRSPSPQPTSTTVLPSRGASSARIARGSGTTSSPSTRGGSRPGRWDPTSTGDSTSRRCCFIAPSTSAVDVVLAVAERRDRRSGAPMSLHEAMSTAGSASGVAVASVARRAAAPRRGGGARASASYVKRNAAGAVTMTERPCGTNGWSSG